MVQRWYMPCAAPAQKIVTPAASRLSARTRRILASGDDGHVTAAAPARSFPRHRGALASRPPTPFMAGELMQIARKIALASSLALCLVSCAVVADDKSSPAAPAARQFTIK